MATSEQPSGQANVDDKIMNDVNQVVEKLEIVEGTLRPGGTPVSSLTKDATLMGYIGFLEACAPRMVQLVEAGAQGIVSESVLMKCLEVNDRLTKVMTDFDAVTWTDSPAAASAPPPPGNNTNTDSSDLLFAESTTAAPGPAVGKSEDPFNDPFGTDLMGSAATTTEAPVPAAKSDDEFDSFFNERTQNPS